MSFIDKIKQNSKKNDPSNILAETENSNAIKLVDNDMHIGRMNICKSCEYLFKMTNTCKKCGCFMSVKTRLKTSSCPIGKW
jgi:hypothetical protein